MKTLNIQELSNVACGDAAATRAPGTNSWGEIIDQRAFTAAACQADGWFSWSCFDMAMKYPMMN